LIRNILKMVTDAREDFLKAAMVFRLAQSDLTLDDLDGTEMM